MSTCDKPGCKREATWGIYKFEWGNMHIDLTKPRQRFCTAHKPRLLLDVDVRAIKLPGELRTS